MTLSKSVKLLLSATFLMNLGTFAVTTFLAIYLSGTLHYSAIQVGTVLTVLMITSRVLPILGGSFADRYGYSKSMVTGMGIRAFGLLSFSVAGDFYYTVASAALTGIGTALYEPAVSAFFSRQKEEHRKRVFTYFNQALNAGAIVGPLLGGLLLYFDASLPFVFGALLYLIIGVFIFQNRKSFAIEADHSGSLKGGLAKTLQDKHFVSFNLIMILFWFMYSQLTIMFPLMMYKITQSQTNASMVVSVNAVCGLLIMFFIRRLFETHEPLSLIIKGNLIMATGLFLSWVIPNPWWLLGCVIIFTIGETLVLPSSDLKVSDYSKSNLAGTYFGVSKISFGIGASIGGFLGPILFELQGWRGLPWVIVSMMGIFGAFLLGLLKLKEKEKIPFISESH